MSAEHDPKRTFDPMSLDITGAWAAYREQSVRNQTQKSSSPLTHKEMGEAWEKAMRTMPEYIAAKKG